MGTCRYCGQNAGFLRRRHGMGRDLHTAGIQEMVQLAAQAAGAHTFNEAALRQTLEIIAQRSHATGEDIDRALEEGFRRGFLYLVAVMDWHSRYVVAWRLSNTLEADFCVDALKEALGQCQPEVFNTDQGSQFTSMEFTHVLQEHGVKISMDGKGRYTDNIFAERLWRTVKYEEVYLKVYANASEARRELGAYFRFYNDQRPHQALGYRTPAEVFHQVTDVGEEGAVQAKESPIDQTLVSLAGAAGLSHNSTSILSN